MNTEPFNKPEYKAKYDELFEKLVPPSGASATRNGELVRAIAKLNYDCYNNGWCNNTSGAVNYILATTGISHPAILYCCNTGGYSDGDGYQDTLRELCDNVMMWISCNEDVPHEDDMFNYADEDIYEDADEDDDRGYI